MKNNKLNALEAINQAQILTFYPIVFQAVIASKRLGILEFLNNNKGYHSVVEISQEISISEYGVKLLLDMLSKVNVVIRDEKDDFKIGLVGFFLINDKQTAINLDFVQDVCYKGAFHLTESIEKQKPIGLQELGSWETIYEGLLDLPSDVSKSWFNFDHFYSDAIFKDAMEIVLSSAPKKIMDIGGNTGKFALELCKHDQTIEITIVDLKNQLLAAEKRIDANNFSGRVTFFEQDMLSKDITLPQKNEIIWMSQFLDCFSEFQIEDILNNITKVMDKNTRVLIVETFWDNQKFDAAEHCLLGTSLYFTCIANGNSRMYSEKDFKAIISKTQLQITNQYTVGEYHTLLELKLKDTDE